ncbi:MAG: hypothetical protein VB877_12810 [Pirellulaceae bacterium]
MGKSIAVVRKASPEARKVIVAARRVIVAARNHGLDNGDFQRSWRTR